MLELNQRIVIKNGSKGVVKYYGPLEGTSGIWVGVDWDNSGRGKHDGVFKGRRYFQASTDDSGSFIREDNLDIGNELLDEIREKYAGDLKTDTPSNTRNKNEIHWEFVKMDKTYEKQKHIFNLQCIVLSWSNVSHLRLCDKDSITFGFCKELDLTETLVGKWSHIMNILNAFPALKILHLNENRIEPLEEYNGNDIEANKQKLSFITHLSMNRCRLSEYTANHLSLFFENLEELYLAENGLKIFAPVSNFACLRKLDLQGNPILGMQYLQPLFKLASSLEYLNISNCHLTEINFGEEEYNVLPSLNTLILQNNPISQWKNIDQLTRLSSLRKLILKGSFLPSARGVDSREIVIAKIPQIVDLDKCDISAIARRSAELLFLTRFICPPIDLQHQSTIERLRNLYNFPKETKEEEMQIPRPSHIQSRRVCLAYRDRTIERMLSLALPIHKVVGLGARFFGFDPDQLRGVELRRSDPGYPPEILSRMKNNLLRQFEIEDGDILTFI